MPKVILVLLLPGTSPHSKVYPLNFFVCKIEKSLPFYPYNLYTNLSGKKELTYYCAPITTTHSHKKLKYWPILGPD